MAGARKSAGAAGIAGAILAAPAALVAAPVMALGRALAPAPAKAARPRREKTAGTRSLDMLAEMAADEGQTQVRPPDEAAASWELAGESLAFSRLRMRGAGDSARGELVAIAQASVYVEAFGARIKVDVGAAIRVALSRAEVDESALPKGYELAHTTDAYD